MHLVMFDIDGTLVDTSTFEDLCFVQAVKSVVDVDIDQDWSSFPHVSDSGIVNQLLRHIDNEVERQHILENIRSNFTELIKHHLEINVVSEIPGAKAFFNYLKERNDVVIAIATGGWRPTAVLKLTSAGFEFSNVAFASSDDHYDRSEIMKIAQSRVGKSKFSSKTYIGDGVWDKTAAKALAYNFILVGSKTSHINQIDNFTNLTQLESVIGFR